MTAKKKSKVEIIIPETIIVNDYLVYWIMRSYFPLIPNHDEPGREMVLTENTYREYPVRKIEKYLYEDVAKIFSKEENEVFKPVTNEIFRVLSLMHEYYPYEKQTFRNYFNENKSEEQTKNEEQEYRFYKMMKDDADKDKSLKLKKVLFYKQQDKTIKESGEESLPPFNEHIVKYIQKWFNFWLENYEEAYWEYNTQEETALNPINRELLVDVVMWKMRDLFTAFKRRPKNKYSEAIDIKYKEVYPFIDQLLKLISLPFLDESKAVLHDRIGRRITSFLKENKEYIKAHFEPLDAQNIRKQFAGKHIVFVQPLKTPANKG